MGFVEPTPTVSGVKRVEETSAPLRDGQSSLLNDIHAFRSCEPSSYQWIQVGLVINPAVLHSMDLIPRDSQVLANVDTQRLHRHLGTTSFADALLPANVGQNSRLEQQDRFLDWEAVAAVVRDIYAVPEGCPSNPPLLLAKVLLLQQWFNESDPEIEAALWDRLSFRRFVGIVLQDPVPDHSTASPLRTAHLRIHQCRLHHGVLLGQHRIVGGVAQLAGRAHDGRHGGHVTIALLRQRAHGRLDHAFH